METNSKQLILLVDDKPTNLKVLSDFLLDSGYEILVAKDGEKALKQIQRVTPDLILLDVMMPGIDGFETCRRLKASDTTKDIPVIFMTALADSADKVKGLTLGGVDYITKPIQREETLARIQVHLRLRSLAKQLQTAKDAAEMANQAKSAFLAKMSHELRTPLNAILGFAQIMNRDPTLTPEQQEHLGIINRSGEHLLELINDVLDMSKIEAGRMAFHTTNFDLSRLLNTIEEMLGFKARAKGLQFTLDLASDVPQYIKTDERKLRQVLINLVGNAIKFTETGGIVLRVSSLPPPATESPTSSPFPHSSISPTCALKFEVEDTGPGISPEEMAGLFEVFVQTETGRNSQEGTGLGLPISQQFARMMGGDITATSQAGRGTTFTVRLQLPLGSAAELPDSQPTRRVMALEPDRQTYRILVADDRHNNRLVLMKLLSPLGFEVKEAANGREALDLWESWEPHLIWIDMRMPVMNGYEVIKRIKATPQGQTTKIIALTASTLEEEQPVILSAGCDDFVRKPFREQVIFDKMARHLGVRYIYEDLTPDPASVKRKGSSASTLTSEALAVMSSEWIAQLYQAADLAEDEVIFQLIAQIPEPYSDLAEILADLVQKFRYEKIIELTEQFEDSQES